MRIRSMARLAVLLLLSVGLVAGSALSQSGRQGQTTTITFTNVCSQQTVVVDQIMLTDGRSLDVTIQEIVLEPGQSSELEKQLNFTPTRMGLGGNINGQEFSFTIDPLPLNDEFTPQEAQGCLEILVEAPGGGTQIPPERDKPIAQGDNLQTVLNTLSLNGIQSHRVEGSQASPKLNDLNDPMFLRAIPGSSFQLVWVSSGAGQLRSVITWDNPSVDLDLIVFGNAGACFQLNGPGILSELCDRAAEAGHGPIGGPVAGNVFAVLIINWSGQMQPYVLSLSS